MRYFIQSTRPGLRYYSYDRDVRRDDCNFVRTHSFFGLAADDSFKDRLKWVEEGKVVYDLPPHVLFDQKATLVLPFWSVTRNRFSEEIRKLLAFSSPLTPQGFCLADGTMVTTKTFSSLPRKQRGYYIKYAGSDVSINWGSKAVFRLSNMNPLKCESLLEKCLEGFSKGRIWLIQKEEKHDDWITYHSRDRNQSTKKLRAKFSGFYGPDGFIAAIAMHRAHNKVHGQSGTVTSLISPRG